MNTQELNLNAVDKVGTVQNDGQLSTTAGSWQLTAEQ